MRRFRRFLIWTVCLLLLLGIVGAVGLAYVLRWSFPVVDGSLSAAGLRAPVEVIRDRAGVPHLYAESLHDLVFAQGYVHAQDRFWQMDAWRHLGSGRLSEMVGPAMLDMDKFLRTLGWTRRVRRELEAMRPEFVAYLQAYSDGVNAYLAERQGVALSVEYGLLALKNPRYRPEPWEPLHTLLWAKSMAWDLCHYNTLRFDVERAKLLKTLAPELVEDLFPPHSTDAPVILPASAQAPLMGEIGPALDSLLGRAELIPGAPGMGSNNWVIGGSRTATGKPILANDPHLGVMLPSIWYQVGLHCQPQGPDCPVELEGFSMPGTPGVVIGHNDRIAWAFTNVGPDVMDLYIEKVNPQNPREYEVNGQWTPMSVTKETILVAGGEPVEFEVLETRHGPVISDTWSQLKDFGAASGVPAPAPYALSLRWTALDASTLFEGIWKIDQARNWDEFREGARLFDVPAQNLIYADLDGNIGYQMPGRIPIRKGGDGRWPVPGWTDDYEWTGYIPFEELPSAYNPPEGFIVTANNPPMPAGYKHWLGRDFEYGFRASRITRMIQEHTAPISVEDVRQMQGDTLNQPARELVPLLLALKELPAKARTVLEAWDFRDSMDSAGAALYETFWARLLEDLYADDLPEASMPGGGSRWIATTLNLARQPEHAFWDDRATPVKETRDVILERAILEALAEVERRLGGDPAAWSWGALHTTTFRHVPFGQAGIWPLDALLNRGPVATAGGAGDVNCTLWDPHKGFETVVLPSMRMIVDLSDFRKSLTIHTTGQSGHAFHPHYDDMIDSWRLIEMQSMLWDKADVLAQSEGRLRLEPPAP